MISLPTVVFLTQRCNFDNIDHVFAQSWKKFGNFLPSSRKLSPNCFFIVNKCSFEIFAQNFLLKKRQNLSYFGSLRSFPQKVHLDTDAVLTILGIICSSKSGSFWLKTWKIVIFFSFLFLENSSRCVECSLEFLSKNFPAKLRKFFFNVWIKLISFSFSPKMFLVFSRTQQFWQKYRQTFVLCPEVFCSNLKIRLKFIQKTFCLNLCLGTYSGVFATLRKFLFSLYFFVRKKGIYCNTYLI